METLTLDTDLALALASSTVDPHVVIARYEIAFVANFTDWLGKATSFAQHDMARRSLLANLRCEVREDHISMLQNFARSCGAAPTAREYEHVEPHLGAVRQLFLDQTNAGLAGVAVAAALEEQAIVFISHLTTLARACACSDFRYTEVHGAADTAHALVLARAVECERVTGYTNPAKTIHTARERVFALLHTIFITP